ncbi:hypothetical protein Ancab_001639, partial [Ancistrocladus abbreviatus]
MAILDLDPSPLPFLEEKEKEKEKGIVSEHLRSDPCNKFLPKRVCDCVIVGCVK